MRNIFYLAIYSLSKMIQDYKNVRRKFDANFQAPLYD